MEPQDDVHKPRDESDRSKDVTLHWENYTSFEDIKPNDQIHLFMGMENQDEKNMFRIRDMIKQTNFKFTSVKDEFDEYTITVSYNKKIMAIVAELENCIVVRFENPQSMKSLKKLFLDEFSDKATFIGIMYNIEEKFTVRDTKVEARIRTGSIHNSPYLAPESFWQFFLNDEYIGRALIKFHSEIMCDCSPIAIMFEISEKFRRKYFGTNLMLGIEGYLFDHGFKKIRLEDVNATSFWEKLGYLIKYGDGEKELGHLDDESI